MHFWAQSQEMPEGDDPSTIASMLPLAGAIYVSTKKRIQSVGIATETTPSTALFHQPLNAPDGTPYYLEVQTASGDPEGDPESGAGTQRGVLRMEDFFPRKKT